jgi:hypothetical protein
MGLNADSNRPTMKRKAYMSLLFLAAACANLYTKQIVSWLIFRLLQLHKIDRKRGILREDGPSNLTHYQTDTGPDFECDRIGWYLDDSKADCIAHYGRISNSCSIATASRGDRLSM